MSRAKKVSGPSSSEPAGETAGPFVALKGGNYRDGAKERRFEAGDTLPALTPAVAAALRKMGAIAPVE